MALLDRLKERIETDLSDTELRAMIDAVTEEIDSRFGANGERTVWLGDDRGVAGDRKFVTLRRRIDTAQAITIVELDPPDSGDASAETTLAADDYRVLHGGRTIERLSGGTNGRTHWAPLVKVTYTPVSDAKRREEVIIQVVQLEIRARGVSSERAGDWQANYPELARAREELIAPLASRRGMVMA